MINSSYIKVLPFILLALTSCSEGMTEYQEKPLCQASGCINANIWMQCDPTTGLTTYIPCNCSLEQNQCLNEKTSYGCDKDICKDDQTLMLCNINSGIYREFKCPCDLKTNKCIGQTQPDSPAGKCTTSICLDSETLLACESGTYLEKKCRCDIINNQCLSDDQTEVEPPIEAKKCTSSICIDSGHLQECDLQTGETSIHPCSEDEICTFAKCEVKKFEEYTCQSTDVPKCIGDTMSMVCEDISGEDEWAPVIHHCTEGRICKDGVCVQGTDDIICTNDVCKDISTVLRCTEGKYTEETCQSDHVCIHGKCLDGQGLKRCHDPSECSNTQTCYQGICYTSDNFKLSEGDPCDVMTFEEYCKGDLEYKCGYDDVVEINDCTSYHGCGLYIKPAYRTDKPTLNAVCRGTTRELAECERPGLPAVYCYSYVDTEFQGAFSFSYSIQDECIMGTDGRMIYAYMEIQNNCNGENMCDLATGLCKN